MEKNICVTGHRPDKLGGYSSENNLILQKIAVEYFKQYINTYTIVYIGMALGWDTAVAQACVSLDIPFNACVPFKGQEAKWSPKDITIYHDLLTKAKDIVIVSDGNYSAYKMHVRNKYMVDHTDTIIAMWDNVENGGTWNCINYGQSKYKEIINLYPKYLNYVR